MAAYIDALPSRHPTMISPQGGEVEVIDLWSRYRRFLILGTDAGTFNVDAPTLTTDNFKVVRDALAENPREAINLMVAVAKSRRAPKIDPVLAALSLALASDNVGTRKLAYNAIGEVCSIPTHMYDLLNMTLKQRGWSAGLKRAIARWVEGYSPTRLAYHAMKYQQRNGMSFRDVLRMSHPEAPTILHAAIYDWICGRPRAEDTPIIEQLVAADAVRTKAVPVRDAAGIIRRAKLPREIIPTEWLNGIEIWDALLDDMPMHAMVRNLGKMTNIGLLGRKSTATRTVGDRLRDPDRIRGMHPLAFYIAARQYEKGRGDRGSLTWTPVADVITALEEAFVVSLKVLTAPEGEVMYAIDTSGSMSGAPGGNLGISAFEGAVIMAMAAAHAHGGDCEIFQFDTMIKPMTIRPNQGVTDVMRMIGTAGGGTNCGLPFKLASQRKDVQNGIVVFTDHAHGMTEYSAHQAMTEAKHRHPELRSVGVALTPTPYAIANDRPWHLNIVGLDTGVPELTRLFLDGDL